MLIRIDKTKPDKKGIKTVVDCLQSGGVIIYPTDTIYTFGCDIHRKNAFERLCRLKNKSKKNAQFSIVCKDLSDLSAYSIQISNVAFRLMKKKLPGPYTFILKGNKELARAYYKKKTLGYRVPDHKIPQSIVDRLGNPIFSTSVKNEKDDILEYITDPEEIYYLYKDKVDIVIDGGMGKNIPSTVVDLTTDTYTLIRQGIGDW